ncbi:hypothetical protein [Bdellovibrio svalbardensis]|uniref:Uncharacterized protein n=1 Tax=Bdellovibrio svalbardensis TaxID=2972972 RepID=A0ABT6DM39_9BACT|nr:hypothetical protein [Bdellovibrio svalbardensis]MDG0817716.1 hypothetical protein [Bdellovibrio svalbardensis]
MKKMMSTLLAVSLMSTAAFAQAGGDTVTVKKSELAQLISSKTATLALMNKEITDLRSQIAEKRGSIKTAKTTRNVGLVIAGAGALAFSLGVKHGINNIADALIFGYGAGAVAVVGTTVAAGGQIYVWVKSSDLEAMDQVLAAKQAEIEKTQIELNQSLAALAE